MYVHTEDIHNFKAAEQVLPIVFTISRPNSILDVGCGIGTWLKVAKDLNVKEITGVDGSYVNRDLLKINETEFVEHDLRFNFNLQKKYDMAFCLEVAEHIPAENSDNLIESLCAHSDIILFSAAIPGQSGQNHINEQWPSYWQEKFNKYGFDLYDIIRKDIWLNKNVDWYYCQNIFLSIKRGHQLTNGREIGYLPLVHPIHFELKMNYLIEEINNLHKQIFILKNQNLFKKIAKFILKKLRF